MHGRNKEFRRDRSRSGQISARPPPIRSRNWEKTWRSASTHQPWGCVRRDGSGRSPSSTFLRVWRTVRSSVGRTSQLPKRYWVSFAGPGHKGIVCLPAGMSFEADGLEHPDQIVEMARARDSAPTHAGLQLRDFQGQAPDFKGIVAAAMEMPQVRLMFWAPIGASGATRTSSAQRHQILDLGRRIYPKTRGRGRR